MIVSALFDVAMGSEIFAGEGPVDEVFSREEGQSTGKVVMPKVNLGQPESIGVVI